MAGGGIAGIEAILALSRLAPTLVDTELLDPSSEFVYKPLLVAEPFGTGKAARIDLSAVAAEAGARHQREGLAQVDPKQRTLTTTGGSRITYDALLVAIGARPTEGIAGAVTFGDDAGRQRFGKLLESIGRRGTKKVAFIVPPAAEWPIAAYELALLTAGERDARSLMGVELMIVTHEPEPLGLLGTPASQLIGARLAEANISLHLDVIATNFSDRLIHFADAEPLAADAAVALPALQAPEIPELPQGPRGFLETDARMRVKGVDRVWAAGDITSSPIKQGGLAAQQADVAAHGIASVAGAQPQVTKYDPVLRGELLTGEVPDFFRRTLSGASEAEAASGYPLWSPATPVAGRHLAPYLALKVADASGEAAPGELEDRPSPADPAAAQGESQEAVRLLLAAADADARTGHFASALSWLDLVERLDLVIPPRYVARRDDWHAQVDPQHAPDPAAARIDPARKSASAAVSDLERRIGWLREIDARSGKEMGRQLRELEDGLKQVIGLSRRAGILDETRP